MKERKMISREGYCYVCGNKGLPDKKCPSCGREPMRLSINLDDVNQSEQFVNAIDEYGVPGVYRGIFWSAEMLRHNFPGKEQDRAFQKFVDQLDKIDRIFGEGQISSKSAIIIAPAGYSKMVFAYSCLQKAISAGLSVAPFLDTCELKRMLTLSGENPNYKLYGKYDYDRYLMADVCFVTVSKLPSHEWAYAVIQELLDRRSRKGLSTFITSRYSLSEISRRDATNQFDVISTANSKDDYKYPAVINYNPRR